MNARDENSAAAGAAPLTPKHTPGPWRALSAQPSQWPEYVIVGSNREYVASVQIRATNPAGDNARLIAAAPELLEALKRMHQAFNAKKPIPKHEGDALEAMCVAAINRALSKSGA